MSDNGRDDPISHEMVRLVIVGHVDHGKSTLVGRLLADTGSLPDGKLQFTKDICDRQGKVFEFAFLLDALEEEQEQGITIDTSQIFFKTQKRHYVIIDAPGHKEFLKNMVTGAANAEGALLLIDAYEGVQEQSRRHGYLLKLLGINQVAVAINKMDLVDYDPEVYFKIKSEYSDFLKSLNIEARQFIPIAAKEGVNIAQGGREMAWYKGPTILEMLDQFEKKLPQDHTPFRFPVQDVYKFDQRRIIAGRVESGLVHVGEEIIFHPSNKRARIKSIEAWSVPEAPLSARASQSVGFTFDEQIFVERGEIASRADESPIVSTTFDVNLFWMGSHHLEMGKTYTIKLTTQELDCEIVEFKKVINASTLEPLSNQNFLAKNDVAEMTVKTKSPVAFDLFGSIPETGRFVLVDGYDVCGGGIVTTYMPSTQRDKLRDEVRIRDGNWIKSNIGASERAFRNGHQAALILLTGESGVGKAKLAKLLEEKIFKNNFQSYLLDGRNILLGVSADIETDNQNSNGEAVRRFSEVAKLFLDAGHVIISTSNVFNQEEHSDIRLIIDPCPLIEIHISKDGPPMASADLALTQEEIAQTKEAVGKIFNFLKEKKILTGHNYSI
ncbi:MAG: GTP-binding protein [Nitrospinota bacterium]|nr:GTP-binding protein [Nitrospinota bacterium]